MSAPSVIQRGGGEIIADSPERRIELLAEREALHVTWVRFEAGREGADLHVHREHSDVFYVLDGELTVRLGVEDEAVAVPAGSFAHVPPHVVHGFRNASTADVVYLNFHAPGTGFADYMRGLGQGRQVPFDQHPPPPDGGRTPRDATVGEAVADEAISIAVREARPEPTTPQHRSFYVLDGELAAGDVRGQAGAWLEVPPEDTVTGAARFLEIIAE